MDNGGLQNQSMSIYSVKKMGINIKIMVGGGESVQNIMKSTSDNINMGEKRFFFKTLPP